jgi:hypothetical protein
MPLETTCMQMCSLCCCYTSVLLVLGCVTHLQCFCIAGVGPSAEHGLSTHNPPTCTTDFSALQHVAMMQAINPNRLNRGSPPLAMTTPPAIGMSVRYVSSLSR